MAQDLLCSCNLYEKYCFGKKKYNKVDLDARTGIIEPVFIVLPQIEEKWFLNSRKLEGRSWTKEPIKIRFYQWKISEEMKLVNKAMLSNINEVFGETSAF